MFVFNADRVNSYGVELDLNIKLLDTLHLETNVGYTHARLDRYRHPISNRNLAGNTPPFAPEYTFLVALQHYHSSGLTVRAELLGTGKTYFDDLNQSTLKQGAFAIANAHIGFESRNFDIYAFGHNLGNKKYFTQKFEFNRAGAFGNPRTFGAGLRISF